MKALLVALILVAGSAWALTVTKTETRLDDFRVLLLKQPGDPAFLVSYRTYDNEQLMREIQNENYWEALTATQKNQVRQIIDGAYNKAHQVNDIPLPSPTPVATPGAAT